MLSLVKQKLSKEFYMSTGKAIKSDVKDLKLAAMGKKQKGTVYNVTWETGRPVLAANKS